MHYVLLALYTLFLIVWFVLDVAWQNLTATILKSLVFVATLTPGFQEYLEKKITTYPMPIAELPSVIRKTVKNPIAGFALRQVDAIDFLEVDENGRLRSLVKSDSKFNGRAPSELSEPKSVMPILILDRANVAAEVDSVGPVLLKREYQGRVRSRSIALLCDTGTLDASRVEAPVLLADRELNVENLSPDSSLLNFASALDGARELLLKTIRGEPLVAADKVGIEVRQPPKRWLPWFLLTRMKCKLSWTGFRCNWELNEKDVQVLVDSQIAAPSSVASRTLGEDPLRISVEVYNPRVSLAGAEAKIALDVVLTAPRGQGVVSNLLAHPVALTNIKAWVGDVVYDPATGLITFSKPRLDNLQTALPIDPSVQKIVIKAINQKLQTLIEERPFYDVKSESPMAFKFLRFLKLEGGKLRLGVGLGRCEENLTRTPAA